MRGIAGAPQPFPLLTQKSGCPSDRPKLAASIPELREKEDSGELLSWAARRNPASLARTSGVQRYTPSRQSRLRMRKALPSAVCAGARGRDTLSCW